MKKSNKRTPVVFNIALALLFCFLFSARLTGGLYARYTATATGTDSARVAKLDVTNTFEDSAPVSVNLNFFDPDATVDTVTILVTSGSEVSLRYDVVVTMPDGFAYDDWLLVTLNGETPDSVVGNVFTFSEVGEFLPNAAANQQHVVTFAIADDQQGKPPMGLANITDEQVTITVHAEQID